MSKGINLTIKDFEGNISNVINNSGLPIGVVRVVLEKLLYEVHKVEDNVLTAEIDAYTKEVEEDENKVS